MLILTRAVTAARAGRSSSRTCRLARTTFATSRRVENAIRLPQGGGADAVKLEGAGPMLVARPRAIIDAGIPVMGHIGLTPQTATMLGGFKAQGRSAAKAVQLYEDALALEAAGCFSIVLEAVPAPVAARITEALTIPTIGIGAGAGCDGQVLVWHDLLGLYDGQAPRFVKQYAELAPRSATRSRSTRPRSATVHSPNRSTPMRWPTRSWRSSRTHSRRCGQAKKP